MWFHLPPHLLPSVSMWFVFSVFCSLFSSFFFSSFGVIYLSAIFLLLPYPYALVTLDFDYCFSLLFIYKGLVNVSSVVSLLLLLLHSMSYPFRFSLFYTHVYSSFIVLDSLSAFMFLSRIGFLYFFLFFLSVKQPSQYGSYYLVFDVLLYPLFLSFCFFLYNLCL